MSPYITDVFSSSYLSVDKRSKIIISEEMTETDTKVVIYTGY